MYTFDAPIENSEMWRHNPLWVTVGGIPCEVGPVLLKQMCERLNRLEVLGYSIQDYGGALGLVDEFVADKLAEIGYESKLDNIAIFNAGYAFASQERARLATEFLKNPTPIGTQSDEAVNKL